MKIQIPEGKKVSISTISDIKGNNRTPIPNLAKTELVLEEDMTLNLNSNYTPVVSSSVNKGAAFFTQVTRELSGFNVGTSFKELGFQMWESTDPLSVAITVGLYMKSDAQFDVFEPMRELIKLPLPTNASLESGTNKGVGLIAPGPTILQALGITKKFKNLLYVSVGNVILYPAVITKVEPTISKETDQFNYPIWAKLRIDIQTIYTATTNLIDEWGDTSGE